MRLAFALAALALASLPAAAAPGRDPWVAKSREMLARAVAFKTTQSQKEVPQFVAYLVAEMKAAGVRDDQITIVPHKDTAALVVRIPGRDRARKAILFSAHMDVVEADPKDWERDPFRLVDEGGFLFGRGASDDKAGVVQLTSIILRLASARLTPSRDLVFAFIGDEETAMETTAMLAGPRKALIDAEFALNADAGGGTLDDKTGKPTVYVIQGGEKTYADFKLEVANPGGHSSQPRDDNAIYRLADAIGRVRALRFPIESNALTRSTLAVAGPVTPGPLGDAMRAFAANPVDGPAAQLLAAEPSLVGQLRTTCVATMLAGGHAPNALPQAASVTVNCRIFPGTSIAKVRDTIVRAVGDPLVKITQLYGSTAEAPVSEPRADVTNAVTRAVHRHYPGVPIAFEQSSGATDGSYYRAAGIPTYGVTGLFIKPGDSFEHGLNERVLGSAFDASIDMWWSIVRDLADPR